MSSVLLAKYLDSTQRTQISRDLASDLSNIENVAILNELLETLDENTKLDISDSVQEFFKGELLKPECYIQEEPVMLTLSKLPVALSSVLAWTEEVLNDVIKNKLNYSFSEEVAQLTSKYIKTGDAESLDLEETTLLQIFNFLEKIYSFEEEVSIPESLDTLVLLFTFYKDEDVSTKAIKTLRFRDFSKSQLHEYIWDLVSTVLGSSSVTSQHASNSYIIWLRFLISLQKSQTTSDIITQQHQYDHYWKFIQLGLISDVHEHRKYALSILKLSIQQITADIKNGFITFTVNDSKLTIETWKRFCTLYEIIGIDTALNQAAAARSDILSLLSLSSPIESSWGLALLSTGFKANMESVRKFALECMYLVKAEDVGIFGNKFLCDVFLKYAAEAQHFQVKIDENDKLVCDYGVKLESFVCGLLKTLKVDDLFSTVDRLVTYLVEISASFAPARIYLTNGLLKGLKKAILTEDQVTKIYKLFESTSEEAIFEKFLQTIHLKLLTKINSNVRLLIDAIVKFVQYNGWEKYVDSLETFLDYVSIHHDAEDVIEFEGREIEYQVVYYSLFNKYIINDDFLKTLASSKLTFDKEWNSEFSTLLTSLIQGTESQDYSNAEHLVDLDIFTPTSFKDIDLTKLFQFQFMKSDFDLERFKFFTKVYGKVLEVSDSSIFQFQDLIKLSSDLAPLGDYDFKTVDIIKAKYLQLVKTYLRTNPIDSEELSTLLKVLNSNIGFYYSNITLCEIIQFLITNYVEIDLITIMEIMESIWEQFSGERLILNQLPMHLTFIETLFHEVILKDCINNEYNSKVLQSIAFSIIEFSYSRRSLLPQLSNSLLIFSKYYKTEFEQCEWLHSVLIKIMRMIQEESNIFRLKSVIGRKFNRELSLGQGDIYESVYGDEEISAKINIISILTESTDKYVTEFFEYLVKGDPFHIVNASKKTDGTEELQRLFSFAILLLICKSVDVSILSKYVADSLIPALESETSPLVRSYIEWIIALNCIVNTDNRSQVLELFRDQGKPTLITSVEKIAFLICQKLPKDSEETVQFFNQFITYLIPNCSSNKPLIRHFSNSLILSLHPEIHSRGLKLSVDSVLELLHEEAKKSESTGKYRSGDALIWDIESDYNLVGIFGGVLTRISPRDIRLITKDELDKYFKGNDERVPIGSAMRPDWKNEESTEGRSVEVNSTLQTKSGAWETVIDLSEQTRTVKRTELIVVSSLVDKPPNLGGICRLCDVLGAGLMTVEDLRVKNHPQFKNVAVTADYWMPMMEVKDISAFMKEKKKEGYTLIGLEQTDKSIVLGHDTPFPSKSLILLGREAEGIPGELLAELDYCVEIRQLGVIRSMNIQTATAVIVHAYSSAQTHLHK